MKKLSYFSYLILIILFIPSCDDFHDDIQPEDDLPTEDVYKTVSDLESALNGVYNAMQENGLAGVTIIMIPELMGENAVFTISGRPEELNFSNLPLRSSNSYITDFWIQAYKTINLCNAILSSLETVEDATLTPDLRNRIEGEALCIRGFLYFELVRYYGRLYSEDPTGDGVPFIDDPVFQRGELTFPSSESVQRVYELAKNDLLQAKELLPPSMAFDRANPRAATAILAKMAFQQEIYEEAGSWAKELLEDENLSLMERPEMVFQIEGNDEMIWAIRYTASDANTMKNFWFGENSGRIPFSSELKNTIESIITPDQESSVQAEGLMAIDLRTMPGNLVSEDVVHTRKYSDPTGADDSPLARLAEFILMRAEVLARTGDIPGAIDLLNQVRARSLRVVDDAGNEMPDGQDLVLFTPDDFPNGEAELIEAILRERRVELCFEGNILQDLIRLKKDVQGFSYNDCEVRLPIPQRELDVNKALKQHTPCY